MKQLKALCALKPPVVQSAKHTPRADPSLSRRLEAHFERLEQLKEIEVEVEEQIYRIQLRIRSIDCVMLEMRNEWLRLGGVPNYSDDIFYDVLPVDRPIAARLRSERLALFDQYDRSVQELDRISAQIHHEKAARPSLGTALSASSSELSFAGADMYNSVTSLLPLGSYQNELYTSYQPPLPSAGVGTVESQSLFGTAAPSPFRPERNQFQVAPKEEQQQQQQVKHEDQQVKEEKSVHLHVVSPAPSPSNLKQAYELLGSILSSTFSAQAEVSPQAPTPAAQPGAPQVDSSCPPVPEIEKSSSSVNIKTESAVKQEPIVVVKLEPGVKREECSCADE